MKILNKIFFALTIFTFFCGASFEAFAKKNIVILATGGTIAGAGNSSHGSKYSSGKVGVEQMINSNPELLKLADLQGEQLLQMGSENMNDEAWLKIGKRVYELVNQRSVDGIVITHGTDTMEETAYFLNLTIKTKKPIILVGAMRPSTSISADGPLNLYNAIAVAASKEAQNKGVLVVFNDKIFAARDVTKLHTTNVAAFNAPNSGAIGSVYYGDVDFYYNPLRTHTFYSAFNINDLESLPKVEILYGYAGQDASLVDKLIENGVEGIVTAGVGDGNIYKDVLQKLTDVKQQNKNLAIVRCARVGGGSVIADVEIEDTKNGFVTSDNLSPQKARILLKLALTKTKDAEKIQKIFRNY